MTWRSPFATGMMLLACAAAGLYLGQSSSAQVKERNATGRYNIIHSQDPGIVVVIDTETAHCWMRNLELTTWSDMGTPLNPLAPP